MPWELRLEPADCTRPSSPCSSSPAPSTPLLLCCLLSLGASRVTLRIYSYQSSQRFRSVLFLTFPQRTASPEGCLSKSNRDREQVIAPLLIIRRVTGQRALTSHVVTGSAHFRQQGGSTGSSGITSGSHHMSSVDMHGKNPDDKFPVGVEPAPDLPRDKV